MFLISYLYTIVIYCNMFIINKQFVIIKLYYEYGVKHYDYTK